MEWEGQERSQDFFARGRSRKESRNKSALQPFFLPWQIAFYHCILSRLLLVIKFSEYAVVVWNTVRIISVVSDMIKWGWKKRYVIHTQQYFSLKCCLGGLIIYHFLWSHIQRWICWDRDIWGCHSVVIHWFLRHFKVETKTS